MILVYGVFSLSFHPSFQKKSEEAHFLGMLLASGKSNKRCENIGMEKKAKTIVVIAKAYFYFFFLSSSAKPAEVLSQIFHVGTELMRMKLI